jgi:polyhydroxyalkanoate synthesis regulator phasin
MWVLAGSLAIASLASAQMPSGVQVPGAGKVAVPSMPSKTDLLSQAKQMVTDLTSMKSSGKLTADQAKQVDTMLPKANSLTTELEKPQVEPSRLTKLMNDLSDLQKQYGQLKAMLK